MPGFVFLARCQSWHVYAKLQNHTFCSSLPQSIVGALSHTFPATPGGIFWVIFALCWGTPRGPLFCHPWTQFWPRLRATCETHFWVPFRGPKMGAKWLPNKEKQIKWLFFGPRKWVPNRGPFFFSFWLFGWGFLDFVARFQGCNIWFFSDLSEASLKYSIEALTSDTNWTTMI